MSPFRISPAWLLGLGLAVAVACNNKDDDDDDDDDEITDTAGSDSGADSGSGDGGDTTVNASMWMSYYCNAAGGCLDEWDNQVDCIEDVSSDYEDTYGYCEFNTEAAQACVDILDQPGECEDYLEALEGTCDPSSVFTCR